MSSEHSPVTLAKVDFSGTRVMVVGDVMLDRYWFGDVQRISPEAPVPIVRVKSQEERLGGAANVALNLSSLGVSTPLLGIVGEDAAGKQVSTLLDTSGIESFLVVDPSVPTTVKLRVIGRQQQLLRVDFEEMPEPASLADKFSAFQQQLSDASVLVLSDYGKGALGRVEQLIEASVAANVPIVVDPKGDDYQRYAGATLLTPNRAELREVVGKWRDEADLIQRAQVLREGLGLTYLLLTRSEEGMTLFSADEVFSVEAQAREVFDVSGAGDTVVALMAAALAAGRPIREAVELANRAGSIVVGKLGTATVTPKELFGS
ncbi:MAG: D-glycero-beta-D-manno-heptose-7-phosphate kinase [Burkholderiaceae bacterium]